MARSGRPVYYTRKALLDMLILQILSLESAHGYAIAQGKDFFSEIENGIYQTIWKAE
jgi:hypothetical protein